MNTKLNSVTFITLILLASFFAAMLSVSEARSLPCKESITKEVDEVKWALKSSSPSLGAGHRHKRLQDLGDMKDSGPTPGVGHRIKTLQDLGAKNSGPSPGEGHKYNTTNTHKP
ncbi:hypothetical protein Lal_00011934 [Lupinus albus]|uniref:Uncharacterized protein n=1 Tax=Lupinus albus TaxID=3870 RepID=A0A6A5N131_LUPAL|nr:hypothetical protein Lalb_Chr06g0165441 [Lupinus albus]KAF1880874.1 hypothetical protein Lal_00011934 [Lupinus albus]